MKTALGILHFLIIALATQAQQTVTSIAHGDWDSPATWSNGAVPDTNDNIYIYHGVCFSRPLTHRGHLYIDSTAGLCGRAPVHFKPGSSWITYGCFNNDGILSQGSSGYIWGGRVTMRGSLIVAAGIPSGMGVEIHGGSLWAYPPSYYFLCGTDQPSLWAPQEACSGTCITAQISPVCDTGYTWLIQTPLELDTRSDTSANQAICDLQTGDYYVSASFSACAHPTVSIPGATIRVAPSPNLSMPAKTVWCGPQPDTLIVAAASASDSIVYQWSPTAGVECPTCPTTRLWPTATQTYQLSAINMVGGCSTLDSVSIVYDSLQFELPQQLLACGTGVNVQAGVASASAYAAAWNDGSTELSRTLTTPGMHWLTAHNQCLTATDTVQVTLLPDIAAQPVPNPISPSGGGFSTQLAAYGTDENPARLTVWSTEGKLLFDEQGPAPAWPPTHPQAVYLYRITGRGCDGQPVIRTGRVLVLH